MLMLSHPSGTEVDAVTIPILYLRKLRSREVKLLS